MPMLNPDHCYQVLLSRDRRFDGRFYVAVRTTRVYCRPVCPVPPPKRKNVEFYPCAAAAETAGFRPCRRCRPELAPGTAAGFDTSLTVTRALRLIANGALDEEGVAGLSSRLNVGERHLRRLFDRELGASPVVIALTRRVHLARKLLTETTLPIIEIAYGAGFNSLRRFNDAFQKSFQQSPREVRRNEVAAPGGDKTSLRLQLPFRPPYAWTDILGFLEARAIPGVEEVADNAYRRTLRFGDHCGVVSVTHGDGDHCLTVSMTPPLPATIMTVLERLRQLFDCDANPLHLADHFACDPQLGLLVAAKHGLRLPGAWSGFELAVRAVLGQQVSIKGARTLARRLVELAGVPLVEPVGSLTHVFPDACALLDVDVATIGLPARRALTLAHLAKGAHAGTIVLDGSADPEETMERLRKIPGVGDWTAQYIAMRALRLPDSFPASDLGLRNAWSARSSTPLAVAAEAWRPWRGYAAMHLWATLPILSSTPGKQEGVTRHESDDL